MLVDPALWEDPENDPLGREEGESAFPEVRDKDFLESVKATQPAYEWDSQYMGRPKASASGNVDAGKIVRITKEEAMEAIAKLDVTGGADLAVCEKQANDYNAMPVLAYDWGQDILYILDMWRNKKRWGVNRGIFLKQLSAFQEEWNMQRVAIEAVAGFGSVYSDIKEVMMGQLNVKACYPPAGGKLSCAQPWLNKIQAGRVRMVIGPWNKDFIAELEVFGGEDGGDNDDQIDAISRGWERITGKRRNGATISKPLPPGAQKSSRARTVAINKAMEDKEKKLEKKRREIQGTTAFAEVQEVREEPEIDDLAEDVELPVESNRVTSRRPREFHSNGRPKGSRRPRF